MSMKKFHPSFRLLLTVSLISIPLVSCSSSTPTVENSPSSRTAVVSPSPTAMPEENLTKVTLTLAEDWKIDNHIHGLAVHEKNPDLIYVATHRGLLQSGEDEKWFWVGSDRSDYMGFSADPANSKRFYSSGHPPTGGNLGFRVTENQGETWEVVSMTGVDFHALAVAPSNPNIIYGWATSGERGFFVSKDQGKNWTQITPEGLGDGVFSLVVTPHHPEHLFATTQSGLFESKNGGKNWTLVSPSDPTPIAGLALTEEENKMVMIGYRVLQDSPGLYRSIDGGKIWEKLGSGTEGLILYLAIAPNNPDILYAVNENNMIFQSRDRGKTWKPLS